MLNSNVFYTIMYKFIVYTSALCDVIRIYLLQNDNDTIETAKVVNWNDFVYHVINFLSTS
jgi:hypothetical protein